jgi:hypothetical protein
MTVLSLDALRELGRELSLESIESRIPSGDDVACIMYTSGSTGPPKGVVIKHSNLMAAIGAINTLVGHHLKPNDMFLAFLPLAHILEYVVELSFVFLGICSGYGRVKTLTDQSVRNCKGDIKAFRPTVMVGVPAMWELIRKGILAQVNNSGSVRKSMFNGAMSHATLRHLPPSPQEPGDNVSNSSVPFPPILLITFHFLGYNSPGPPRHNAQGGAPLNSPSTSTSTPPPQNRTTRPGTCRRGPGRSTGRRWEVCRWRVLCTPVRIPELANGAGPGRPAQWLKVLGNVAMTTTVCNATMAMVRRAMMTMTM